jgi:predicted CoA-binding protein
LDANRSGAMNEPEHLLTSANRIVVVDWPSRDVPDTLAGAGYAVLVKGGPAPDDFAALELRDGGVAKRPTSRPQEPVDIVYVHRPLAELAEIVLTANSLGARTVWYQSGLMSTAVKDPKGCWLPEIASREARALVQSAGMRYVDDVYIADAVRRLGIRK